VSLVHSRSFAKVFNRVFYVLIIRRIFAKSLGFSLCLSYQLPFNSHVVENVITVDIFGFVDSGLKNE